MTGRRGAAGRRTSARILDAALELFNERGTGRTTTNHIADHLGISPGNLYYWYSDKQEIVRALWQRYAAAHGALWEADDVATPDALIHRLAEATELTAAYRFLPRELPALVHADPLLRDAYLTDRDRRTALVVAVVRTWRAEGLVRLDEAHVVDLARALWLLTETWYASVEVGGQPTPADAERLLGALIAPYIATD